MSCRVLQGVAETGSGKTAAFLLPMLVHIMEQPELREGEGPIAVILAPTRELAEQIHREARRFSKGYGLRVCAAFGGLEKRNQVKDLKAGSEVRSSPPLRFCRCAPSIPGHTDTLPVRTSHWIAARGLLHASAC